MQKTSIAMLAIMLTAAIWGSTFFVIKDAVATVDPVDFLAARFAVGALLPALLFLPRLLRLSWRQWRVGLGLGVIYGLGQITQTIGLTTTSASVSGFITGTHVVITPLIVWAVFRIRPGRGLAIALVLAVAGLAALSLTGGPGGFGVGEALTLTGAAIYAVHIVVLDRHAKDNDPVSLAIVQLIGVALTCTVAGLPGGFALPLGEASVWGAVLYTGIVAGVVTMGLQSWAQRYLAPTRTALLMTLEPVFAALFALALGGEHLTWRLAVGGSLIVLATVVGVGPIRPADEEGGRGSSRGSRRRR